MSVINFGRNIQVRNMMARAVNTKDLANLTNEEICEKYGVSMSTVGRYRAQTRVPSPVPPKRATSHGQKVDSQIVQLRLENYSYLKICQELHLPKTYVRKVLAQHGLAAKLKKNLPINITPNNCSPACYDDLPEPDFEFQEPGVRERYEQLRRWKEEKYHSLLASKRKRI